MLNISPIGRNCSREERNEFEQGEGFLLTFVFVNIHDDHFCFAILRNDQGFGVGRKLFHDVGGIRFQVGNRFDAGGEAHVVGS